MKEVSRSPNPTPDSLGPEDILTVKQIADLLQVSDSHVYDLIKEGRIRKIAGLGHLIRVYRKHFLEDTINLGLQKPDR